MDAVTVHTADLQGLDGLPSKTNDNDSNISIGMRRDSNLELQRRRRGDLDFELGAHISLIAPIIRGSATKTTRCGTPATIGQRLILSGCPAFGIPSRLSRKYFSASGGAACSRTVLDGQRGVGSCWGRPAHCGMVADNTLFGDVRHDGLSLPAEASCWWVFEMPSVGVSTLRVR